MKSQRIVSILLLLAVLFSGCAKSNNLSVNIQTGCSPEGFWVVYNVKSPFFVPANHPTLKVTWEPGWSDLWFELTDSNGDKFIFAYDSISERGGEIFLDGWFNTIKEYYLLSSGSYLLQVWNHPYQDQEGGEPDFTSNQLVFQGNFVIQKCK